MTTTFVLGTLGHITANFINPYTGDLLAVDGDYYINDTYINGGSGSSDVLLGSVHDQFFTLEDSSGNLLIEDFEVFLMAPGGDVLLLASATNLLGDLFIQGSDGNDIIWSNVGADIIGGGVGDDIIHGGPGHDTISGGDGVDILSGGVGDDIIEGNTGDDILNGGDGDDTYLFAPDDGFDVITETSGLDVISFSGGVVLSDLTFTQVGDDLDIDILSSGLTSGITITDFYSGNAGSVVEEIQFDDSSTFDMLSLLVVPNTAPIAIDDSVSGAEDTIITGNVLGNDTDVDGDTLSATPATITTINGATVNLLADGSFTYISALNYNGADSFDYTVLDGQGGSDTGTVSLSIAAVNDGPVAASDSVTTNEDIAVTFDVLGNDSDVDGDILNVTFVNGAINGVAVINIDNTITYTPDGNFNGTEILTYTIDDGNGGTSSASITVSITAVNDGPVAVDDSASGVEDTVITGNVLGNDTDVDGDTLSATPATITTLNGGTVVLLADGSFTYTPALNYNGADSFDYTVLDGQGGSDIGTVSLSIAPEDLILTGTAGDDTLLGGAGSDIIDGGLGSDLLSGGAGDDLLVYSNDEIWPTGFVAWNVGAPDAIIDGDRVTVAPRYRSHDAFDGGDGIDTIQMGSDGDALFLDDRYSANPFGYNTARLVDVEIIRAGAGDDIIDLTSKQFSYGDVSLYGEEGNDVLWGNAGNDYISGGIGNDHLDGASGNDMLVGGAGDDKMYGWSGDDVFIIGEGADQVYSGVGSDQIIIDMIDGLVDTIHDFSAGSDVLDISGILIGYDPLTDAISDFVQITDNGTDSFLAIDADGGADSFIQIAILSGVTGLTDEDALVISGDLVV